MLNISYCTTIVIIIYYALKIVQELLEADIYTLLMAVEYGLQIAVSYHCISFRNCFAPPGSLRGDEKCLDTSTSYIDLS